jgi:hypothetical protein
LPRARRQLLLMHNLGIDTVRENKLMGVTAYDIVRGQVNVANTLSARIKGSGDIRYKGDPRVQQQITGSGHLANAVWPHGTFISLRSREPDHFS